MDFPAILSRIRSWFGLVEAEVPALAEILLGGTGWIIGVFGGQSEAGRVAEAIAALVKDAEESFPAIEKIVNDLINGMGILYEDAVALITGGLGAPTITTNMAPVVLRATMTSNQKKHLYVAHVLRQDGLVTSKEQHTAAHIMIKQAVANLNARRRTE